jgi:hypothetical protein
VDKLKPVRKSKLGRKWVFQMDNEVVAKLLEDNKV